MYCQYGCDLALFDELIRTLLYDGVLLCCTYNHPTLLKKVCAKLTGYNWEFKLKLDIIIIENPQVEILKILIDEKLLDSLYLDAVLKSDVNQNNLSVVEYLLAISKINIIWIDRIVEETILSCSLECFKLLYATSNSYHAYLYRAAYIVSFLLQLEGVHLIESIIRDVIHNSIILGHLDVADVIIDRYPDTRVYPTSIFHTLLKGKFKISRKLSRNIHWD